MEGWIDGRAEKRQMGIYTDHEPTRGKCKVK
jgi:hypothetical protein